MDPLVLLRQLNRSNALPAMPEKDAPPPSTLRLGDYEIAADAETGWSMGGRRYSVLALVVMLHLRNLNFLDYLQEVRNRFDLVSRAHRLPLLEFLDGAKAEAPEPYQPPVLATPLPGTVAAEAEAKKRAAEETTSVVARPDAAYTAAAPGVAAPSSSSAAAAAAAAAEDDGETVSGLGLSKADVAELKAKRAKRMAMDGSEGALGGAALVQQVKQRELVLETRSSVLSSPGRSFEAVYKLFMEVKRRVKQSTAAASADRYERYQQPGQREETGKFNINFRDSYMPGTMFKDTNAASSSAANSASAGSGARRKRTSKTPIIIVPAGTKSILTMYNIKEFLENGRFETNEKVIERGEPRVKYINIQRKRAGQTVNYRVTDSPGELRPEDWGRVVAVFVAGPEWQFSDWPDVRAGQRPVDLFTKYKAFYVCWHGEKPHPNIKDWDCVLLELSRSKRHLDATSSYQFWDSLDQWNKAKHSELRY